MAKKIKQPAQKKRNPADLTKRNEDALKNRIALLDIRYKKRFLKLEARVKKLEGK